MNKTWNARIIAVMAIMTVVGMLVCGYGHAALSTDLLISGEAGVRASAPFASEYLQDLTPEECKKAGELEQKRMIDKRDGNEYWVIKQYNGACWMVENLRLELSVADTLLTSEDSDVESDWAPKFDTQNTIPAAYAKNEGRSFYFDGYIIINPTTTANCGTSKTGPSQCPNQVMAVGDRTPSSDPDFYAKNGATYNDTEYDAHYRLGVYYQYDAATANTGTGTATGTAPSSICPKGWTLPTEAQFRGLPMTYAGEALLAPYFYTNSGYIAGANKLAYVGYRNSSGSAYLTGTMANTSRTACGAFGCLSSSKHIAMNMRCVLRAE